MSKKFQAPKPTFPQGTQGDSTPGPVGQAILNSIESAPPAEPGPAPVPDKPITVGAGLSVSPLLAPQIEQAPAPTVPPGPTIHGKVESRIGYLRMPEPTRISMAALWGGRLPNGSLFILTIPTTPSVDIVDVTIAHGFGQRFASLSVFHTRNSKTIAQPPVEAEFRPDEIVIPIPAGSHGYLRGLQAGDLLTFRVEA